jgi:hypothetical protein
VDKSTKAAASAADFHKSNRFSLSFSLAQSLLARALDMQSSTNGSSSADHATQTLASLQNMLHCLQQHPVYACYVSTDNTFGVSNYHFFMFSSFKFVLCFVQQPPIIHTSHSADAFFDDTTRT